MRNKKKEEIKCFLRRIKNTSELVSGNSYYIRTKIVSLEPNLGEKSQDIIFKEVFDEFLVEKETNNKFSVFEFDIFERYSL